MDLDLDQKKQSVSISKEYILAASNVFLLINYIGCGV